MPDTITRGKHATQRLWTAGAALSVLLAAWVGFMPLFQAAHIALADHDHRYCFRHRQIEDIPRITPSDPSKSDSIVSGQSARSRKIPGGALIHVACAFLNHSSDQDPSVVSVRPWTIGPSDQNRNCVTLKEEVLRACPLLLTAPKTSPPLAVA